jgi:hypothetical protein
MSVFWHIKFAAVARLAEKQFVCTAENWVSLLVLRDENLRLILSVKEGKHFEDRTGVLK